MWKTRPSMRPHTLDPTAKHTAKMAKRKRKKKKSFCGFRTCSHLGHDRQGVRLVAEVPSIQTRLRVIAESRALRPVPVYLVAGTTASSALAAAAAAVGGIHRGFAAKFRRVRCKKTAIIPMYALGMALKFSKTTVVI